MDRPRAVGEATALSDAVNRLRGASNRRTLEVPTTDRQRSLRASAAEAATGEEMAVKAKVGDRLVEEGTHVGDHRRIGVITALRHDDGTPPYVVRWLDTDHETVVYPGPDARIEPAHDTDTPG